MRRRKKQVFRVCGQCCGQARFCGGIFRRGISAAGYCPKGFRAFTFGGMDRPSILPKQARYQLRYTRLWNCFICGLSCGLSRFLTNGFAEIVPASGGVPAVCEVGLFPSWMGGIRSQITRAANYATFGHRYFSRPGAFFPTYVRQYTLRSAALALWHHL